MKTKPLFFGLISLLIVLFSNCSKEDDLSDSDLLQGNARLKCVLLFATIDSEEPISILEEYEYDEKGRISKVSSPMYQDGIIVGTISYDLYEYNSSGQLMKIVNYRSNINSPTGFINLKNYIYSYSSDGKIEREYIEYTQMHSFEYFIYEYQNNQLVKIKKYDNKYKLESYVVNQYDNSGKLIKEKSYAYDNHCTSYTQHSYSNGLNIKSDVYQGDIHLREILRTYDLNNNLIILESNELYMLSSAMSCVLRYEYYEE